jgi:serine/threonine-protein kinase
MMAGPLDVDREAPSTVQPRERAGRYELFAAIGAGGMASVQIGRLLGPGGFARTVAVKRPLPGLARDADFKRMAINEARLASRVHHSNVVATLDVVEHASEFLVVMEYVHGESFAVLTSIARTRGERVPLGILAAVLTSALRGLHAVHQALDERGRPLGLIHRDVSPQNILCGADGLVRLSDFGLAKAAGDTNLTAQGEFRGKLTYASPEQVELCSLTQATDIYSMGVILWEGLVGQRLYEGLTSAQIVGRLLHNSIRSPADGRRDVPAQLAEIAERALQRAPSARFPSALAMASAIEQSSAMASVPDVAAWVRELARDRLEARERLVAVAERQTTPSKRGSGLPQPTPAAALPAAHARTVAARSPARPRARTRALALPALGLLAGVALGWVAIERFALEPRPPEVRPALVTLSPALPALARASAALAPTSASSLVKAMPVYPSASVAPSTSDRGKAELTRRGEAQRAKHEKLDCSPPFSIDSEGIRHMKAGCL